MKQKLRRVTACVLTCFLMLTAVSQPARAAWEPELEIVTEGWGRTESSFAVRCGGDVRSLTAWAAVFRNEMFCGCGMATNDPEEEGLFWIPVRHLPIEDGDTVSVRVFLLNKQTLAPQSKSAQQSHTFDQLPETDPDAVAPLGVKYSYPDMESVGGVDPFGEYWYQWDNNVPADLSAAPALAYSLSFSDATTFAGLPAGYAPEELLEWGKYPGLNMDVLHRHGFTGEGAVVAYVDQPIGQHEQYSNDRLHYINNTDAEDSMHGPAVLSLLAGKDIGTAPDMEVYFYGHAAWEADQTTHAECLYQIIEKNRHLPAGEKITMVGFSDNIDTSEANAGALREAVQACQDAGVMVWFCAEYGGLTFLPMSDKNNPKNLMRESWGGGRPELVWVPASGRTTAAVQSEAEYIYWGSGGLSWTMPYVLGLYGIVLEIDPSLSQDDLRAMIVETAYDVNGLPVVNPVAFVAAALEGVGRGAEAAALRRDVTARQRYLYAVMDTAAMTEADLNAVGEYLAAITDASVLVVDAASFSSAEEIYAVLQKDAEARGGQVAGVQIFGTPAMVPAFQVQYKVQMHADVFEDSPFLTDLFYGNFENDPALISQGYNVMDHFAEGWDVELIPEWPVARLPLKQGEYTDFMDKYMQFTAETGLQRPELVNFSNPIFASTRHIDDMGTFLRRMDTEFGLLDSPYRLYGNLKGEYPVTTAVLGGFTAENLTKENERGMTEFLINSHGQWNNIDKCWYENGQEVIESLLNMDTIGSVLDDHTYYLDCWTSLNGSGMSNNLTTAALNGQCVGMFSATDIISSNGVDCRADLAEMSKSNFYYFYYHYLKALHAGETRSRAFSAGQRAYAEALVADSVNGIRPGEGNYQFNLCNLLAYHNFGLLEPSGASAAFESVGYISQAGQSVPKEEVDPGGGGGAQDRLVVTDGTPVGPEISIHPTVKDELKDKIFTIHGMTARLLDNGYMRFTLEYTCSAEMPVSVFDPPAGDLFMMFGRTQAASNVVLVYDLPVEVLQQSGTVTSRVNFDNNDKLFLYFQTQGLV